MQDELLPGGPSTRHGQILVVVHPVRSLLAGSHSGAGRVPHRLAGPCAFPVVGDCCQRRVADDLDIDHIAHASIPSTTTGVS